MNEEIIIDAETLHSEIGGTWNFDSALEATLYDSEGHEIELKENHCLIIGRDAYGQIPMTPEPPADHLHDARKYKEYFMSLDVYLYGESSEVICRCPDCGHEHTRIEIQHLFDGNLTSNLCPMTEAAGCYDILFRADEIGITRAKELIQPLENALKRLKASPEKYRKLNPENGWGTYEGLVSFMDRYLAACIEYPDARVEISV